MYPGVLPRESKAPLGGRVHLPPYREAWLNLPGCSEEVKRTISEGVAWSWKNRPPTLSRRQGWDSLRGMAKEDVVILQEELAEALQRGAVREALPDEAGFFSKVRIARNPKPRLIANLRGLNRYIKVKPFKQEGLPVAEKLLRPGDFLTSVDLTKAYWHLCLREDLQPYTMFRVGDKRYCWTSLPFGISIAPRMFTKLMKQALRPLRALGLRIVAYMDDILLMAPTQPLSLSQTARLVSHLQDLGLEVSWKKSEFAPSHTLRFLGFLLDSAQWTMRAPEGKWLTLWAQLDKVKPGCRTKVLARAAGLATSMRPAVPVACLFTRAMNALVSDSVKHSGWGGSLTPLTEEVKEEIGWWRREAPAWDNRPLAPLSFSPQYRLTSDASPLGWGAHGTGPAGPLPLMRGAWDPWPSPPSSALLEISALLRGLQLLQEVHDAHVVWRSDNSQLYWDVNRLKSARKPLNEVLKEIAKLLKERRVVLRVEWIPREANSLADWLSKIKDSDWMLHPSLFQMACAFLKTDPTVDCFATSSNALLPRYFTRFREAGSAGTDFFSQSLRGEVVWANPPFNLISSVLRHLQANPTSGLLVIPQWETQPWWAVIREILVQPPLLLPRSHATFLPGVRANWVGVGAARFNCWVVAFSTRPGDVGLAAHIWGENLLVPSMDLVKWAARPQNQLTVPRQPVTLLL